MSNNSIPFIKSVSRDPTITTTTTTTATTATGPVSVSQTNTPINTVNLVGANTTTTMSPPMVSGLANSSTMPSAQFINLRPMPDTVASNNNVTDYDALSHSPNPLAGHEPLWESLYRSVPDPYSGKTTVITPFSGLLPSATGEDVVSNVMEIAWTRYGDRGVPIVIIHGVPTNRYQWHEVARRLGHFCRVLTFDMLGMGESSMPLNYGLDEQPAASGTDPAPWDWVFDCVYIRQLIEEQFPEEQVCFIADDWGGGIVSHASYHLDDLLSSIGYLDPIAFDGYPVSEIQAFGRASQLSDDQFMMALGSADQTMVQIFKTMVNDPNTYNQYNLRDIKRTYADTDYERSAYKDGEDATSLTLRLHPRQMRVLTDRSAILSPALLLPYHPEKNQKGVPYDQFEKPVLVMWGENDNMMPAQQGWRFQQAFRNAQVSVDHIPRAGHFAAQDQPDIVAERIMNFIILHYGPGAIADIFYGFGDRGSGGRHVIWKGDEKEMISDLRTLNGF